jgi:hypothetical protein
LAEEKETSAVRQEPGPSIEDVKRRLDMLDGRLDNIDSIVTAVAELIMNQPVAINITCPRCGKKIEISVMGREKPTT